MDQIATATFHGVPLGEQAAYFTLVAEGPAAGECAAEEAYGRLGHALAREGMEVLHERVFGSLDACQGILRARAAALRACGLDGRTPVTYVEGRPPWGSGFAGASAMAVRPAAVEELGTVRDAAGRPCGRTWKSHGASFAFLQSLHGRMNGAPVREDRSAQADRMFGLAEELLRGLGAGYRSVVRTWLYVSDLLAWYDEFNVVRSSRYERFGLMPGRRAPGTGAVLLPASTGIQGNTPSGAAVTMDLFAAVPGPHSNVQITQMRNPRQKDAFEYGSAFSRGAVVRMPGGAWITFSGTAAIDAAGRSCFPGDFAAQMDMTLDVVEALIGQEGAALSDICNATLFLKHARHAAECRRVLRRRGLGALPGVPVVADVCREELLFEMDGMAIVPR